MTFLLNIFALKYIHFICVHTFKQSAIEKQYLHTVCSSKHFYFL